MKRVIRLGDPTTHGGKVVSAAPNSSANGKHVARLGDKVTCPLPGHGVVTIVEGDPAWLIDGIPVALEGHKTSCGASLISTLPTLGRSWEGDGSSNAAVGIAGLAVAAVGSGADAVNGTAVPAPSGSSGGTGGAAEATGGSAPLTPSKIETLLGVALSEEERGQAFIHFVGTGVALNAGLDISELNLLIPPSLKFDEKSAFAFEIQGGCISLDEIRERYENLEVTQHPRGRSLEETTVYSKKTAWGVLSFAFKESRPGCLFRVFFRKPLQFP